MAPQREDDDPTAHSYSLSSACLSLQLPSFKAGKRRRKKSLKEFEVSEGEKGEEGRECSRKEGLLVK